MDEISASWLIGKTMVKVAFEDWAPAAKKIHVYRDYVTIFWCGFNYRTLSWFFGQPAGWCFYSWERRFPIEIAIAIGMVIALLTHKMRLGR